MIKHTLKHLFKKSALLYVLSMSCFADADTNFIETILVEGRQINLLGEALSASQGIIGEQEINAKPMLRTGEILELIPGMVVTQHSGTGKANQYFLRGFNLDHGTDFNTNLDGMPINMRTHGHGHGYTDLNFIIPETIHSITYQKGVYFSDVGDFNGAGSAKMFSKTTAKSDTVKFTHGSNNYSRAVAIHNVSTQTTQSLLGVELQRYDGPWTDIDEDLQKVNLILKHKQDLAGGELNLGYMAYKNSWNSADQIPERAVRLGIIDELGSLDTSTGGESKRNSINAQWRREQLSLSIYAIQYSMTLWNNFTYFLTNTIDGDQFEQTDDRRLYGFDVNYDFTGTLNTIPISNTIGAQYRFDDISEVGLYKSINRKRTGAISVDDIQEASIGVFWQSTLHFNPQWRALIGARLDHFTFDVNPLLQTNSNNINLLANKGSTDDSIPSINSSLIYTANNEWEAYLSFGQGFHSNDARGTTISLDPTDGSAVDKVDPLVRSVGYEIGLRGFIGQSLNTSMSIWQLDLDSELVFVGDAGNTEASRASTRKGIELAAYYQLSNDWAVDLEYAWTDAKYSDTDVNGNKIPGALEQVIQAGISTKIADNWHLNLRLRYFGGRPLVEDNSVRSEKSTLVNFQIAKTITNWKFKAEILNLLNSNDHDIDYFYESKLRLESTDIIAADIHYHVLEPRTYRITVNYSL